MVLTLRELDERLVPRAAALLRGALDDASLRWTGLRSLARRGPLGLLRDVPQLGILLAFVVFLTGAGLAVTRSTAPGIGLTLGPPVGSEIEGWFALAQTRALEESAAAPNQRFLALVSLTGQITPADAGRLVGESGLEPRRAYLRAPVTSELPEVLTVEVPGDLVSTLTAVYDTTARRKTQDESDFRSLADSIESASDEQAVFTARYEDAALVASQEAAAYRAGCACVFALVVEATAGALAELRALPQVRGVELAQRGAVLESLRIDPLPPALSGVRPAPAVPIGAER